MLPSNGQPFSLHIMDPVKIETERAFIIVAMKWVDREHLMQA
jgi:hypothetical protein